MAIYTLREIKEEFTKYASGDTKLTVTYIWLLKSILKKCNSHKEQEILQLLLDDL